MGGVTEDGDSGAEMMRSALDADNWKMRVHAELLAQRFGVDELGTYAGEVQVEKSMQVLGRVIERKVVARGCEQRACERLIRRWEGDKHEFAARPDVQMVWRDAKFSIIGGRDAELAPQGVDVLLLEVEAGEFHHMKATCGVRPISTDEVVE